MENVKICKSVFVGQKYGKYTVQQQTIGKTKHIRFLCLCDCGNPKNVLAFSLKSGQAWNCGCETKKIRLGAWGKKLEDDKKAWKKKCNNNKHLMSSTKEYRAWIDMKSRCTNKSNKWYPSYGARGVNVCKEWNDSFEAFFNDMGLAPSKKHQIDRKDNNASYSKENCRWTTASKNQRNKSTSRIVSTPRGSMNISDASEFYGLSQTCINYRLKAGWSVEKTFATQSQRNRDVCT